MTVPTLTPFPYTLNPISNIVPFTYRDGETYLSILENLRLWINSNLVPTLDSITAGTLLDFQAGVANAELAVTTAEAGWLTTYNTFIATITAEVALINDKTGPMAVQHQTLIDNTYVVTINPLWPLNQPVTFDLTQDATGGRTVTLGAGITGPLDLNPAVNGRTVFTLVPLSDATWQIMGNSYTLATSVTTLAGKLDTTVAASTYETQTGAAATYQTQTAAATAASDAATAYLTKTAAALTYPTKKAVINGQAPERRASVRGGKTAFLGDSYVSGVGPSIPANRWTSLYAAASGFVESNLANPSSGYVNEGTAGRTAVQAASIPLDTDRVIVCAGINDTSFTATQIAFGVTETIGAIRTRVPNAEIVIISPMWWAAQPTDGLLFTEKIIRTNVTTDIRFVEGGPWLRQGRPDMQISDGHPNNLGSTLIAAWAEAKLENTGPGGALEGSFERTALSEDEVVTSATTGVGLAGGTIYDARPGKWKLTTFVTMYGTTDGFVWTEIAAQRQNQRWGITTAASTPITAEYVIEIRHPGGDLIIQGGITMNGPVNVLMTGTRAKAQWIAD